MNYTSRKLGCSIELPSGWTIDEETLVAETKQRTREEAYEAFRRAFPDVNVSFEEFGAGPQQPSVEEAYRREKAHLEEIGLGIVSFEEFTEIWAYEQQQKREQAQNRLKLEEMMVGYLDASLHSGAEFPPTAEIIKYLLEDVMTPLELYELDRGSRPLALEGNRPYRGMVVDGLRGEKYYYSPSWRGHDRPRFCKVYLADSSTGWIISCFCNYWVFKEWKSTFTEIISSFHRVDSARVSTLKDDSG
jgi:hypothetical protein